jgi:UDP-N-acetylmuramate-alanine ligase
MLQTQAELESARAERQLADADAIVENVAPRLRTGDVVAILSNGGFGGIYEKLPERLKLLADGRSRSSDVGVLEAQAKK